jgi:hypothetical protein
MAVIYKANIIMYIFIFHSFDLKAFCNFLSWIDFYKKVNIICTICQWTILDICQFTKTSKLIIDILGKLPYVQPGLTTLL